MSTAGVQMKVSPHTIPGAVSPQNQHAFDWGWQGLVAYGCHSTVVVIDPRSVQPVQTLSYHKSSITRIRWMLDSYHHTLASPYVLKLASVDATTQCVIWDVVQGTVLTEFLLGGKPVVDLQWLNTNDSCRDMIAVMHSQSTMSIWNADTGTKVSRFTFAETILAFTFNPFQLDSLVLLSNECFIFVSDFNPSRLPTGGGKKFYLTTGDTTNPPFPGHKKVPPKLQRKLQSGDQLKGEETIPLTDCLQVTFSRSCRHHLFLLYPREVVILDVEINQAVGVITLERNASPLLYLMPCIQRDVIYCLHENGCVSVRIQQALQFPNGIPTSTLDSQHREVHYELHGHSEPLRISKSCQVYTSGMCPVTENKVAVFTSEGKILFWDIQFDMIGIYSKESTEDLDSIPTLLSAHPVSVDCIQNMELSCAEHDQGITLGDTISPHWFTPPEDCTSSYGLLSLKMIMNGLWAGISGKPKALRMCPPLTTKNWSYYAPQIAIGTSTGSVLVFNLSSRALQKEYSVHSCPVHGIEWLSQVSFVSYAYTNPNAAGNVRNEIAVTDIQTGRVTQLKRPDVAEGTLQCPIDAVKISLHKSYLVVKYKDRPLEFWDVKTLTFLRELVSNPATFSCIEWSPSHKSNKNPKTDPLSLATSTSAVDFDMAMGASDSKISSPGKEMLTVMDETGSLWQISIEGSKVRVVNSVPTQTWLNNPVCITWKGDLMAAGDVDGVLIFYDAKGAQARTIETTRAAMKKLRFAPGKGNTKMFVLYNNRIDVREAVEDTVLGQLKWGPKETNIAVEDAEWATSDKPILLTTDGCVRIYDLHLNHCQSAINILDFADPLFCPHAIPANSALKLKSFIQHQSWRIGYALSDEDFSDSDPANESIKLQLKVLPDEFRNALLNAPLGAPERSLISAQLYGDEREVSFWSLALYYLLREKHRMEVPKYSVYKSTQPSVPSSDIIRPDSSASISIKTVSSVDELLGSIDSTFSGEEGGPHFIDPEQLNETDMEALIQAADLKTLQATPPLDLSRDLLCDSKLYQRMQLERILLHDSKRQTYDQTRKCAETLLLLRQTDRAVQLLLETDSSSGNYYTDALKACLAATIRSSGASQSTIKLVATNLIANSRLFDGVQLLCLIDKGQDACRYLQTYGEWYHSVWLAKSTLNEKDSGEIFSRWAENLSSVGVNQKEYAVLVILSLGHFYRVIDMLYNMKYYDRAAVFTEACIDYGLVAVNEETSVLIEAVFLEYARYLHKLGLLQAMRYYCDKAGEKGKQLFEQFYTHGQSAVSSFY